MKTLINKRNDLKDTEEISRTQLLGFVDEDIKYIQKNQLGLTPWQLILSIGSL